MGYRRRQRIPRYFLKRLILGLTSRIPIRHVMAPVADVTTPGVDSDADDKWVCQAHLLHMDRSDGTAVSPKPCHGKRVKSICVLNTDWFFQSGTRVVPSNGPVEVRMCGKHRDTYEGRKDELKCQTDACWELGI